MRNYAIFIPVYWVLLGGALAIVAMSDGPVAIVAVAGGVVGVALAMLIGARRDPEQELQRMAAGGDPNERG